jgi:hypothetical protein
MDCSLPEGLSRLTSAALGDFVNAERQVGIGLAQFFLHGLSQLIEFLAREAVAAE